MGKVPVQDTKRNEELIADYIAHVGNKFTFTTAQLVGKYKISASRIYEILDIYEVPRRTPKKSKKKKK